MCYNFRMRTKKSKSQDSRPPRRRILLLADFAYASARSVASGVIGAVSARPDATFVISGGHPDNKDSEYAMRREIDGVITCESVYDAALRRVLKANPRCPVVFASVVREQVPQEAKGRSAVVLCDNAAVAKAAADFLIRHDLAHFGYVGTRLGQASPSWDRERREAFAAALAARGFSSSAYAPPPSPADADADHAALATWLRALPKPCGVFVSYDLRALAVLNALHAEGIAVPEQVQLVSADNEEWLCEHTSPTLTSIEPDFEGCGRIAAETLFAMIDGGKWEAERTFGVLRIEQRMSTTDLHGSANRAVRARRLLRAQMCGNVSSESLAAQLGCSRRMLQLSYKAVFGRTVQEDLIEMRLEKAKRMLAGSDIPACEIPERLGFESPDHLMRLFKRQTGMTMLQWRRRARAAGR